MSKNQKGKTRKAANEPRFRKGSVEHLLEKGSLDDLRLAKRITEEHLKYQWNLYSEIARQRSTIQDQIKLALTQTCISYEFKSWQRAVKYKYGLHPLSTRGSLNFIGGRFNTGSGVNPEVPSFPGLYIAKDKDTALQEHLGQQKTKRNSKLSSRELALTNPISETIVSISGKLDKIFDLTKADNMIPFVQLIKNFKLSKDLVTFAHSLKIPKPRILKTAPEVFKTLLLPEWRLLPSLYDVPSNSQIFGYLVYSAGVEGILYSSKFTGSPCLVLYPKNFAETDSFISLDDEVPHQKVPIRLDASNWRVSEMDA